MEFFNTYEFWIGISGLLGALFLLWKIVAKRNDVPLPADMMVSDTIQEMQKMAKEQADYVKQKQIALNESKNNGASSIAESPQKVLESNHKPEIKVENGEVEEEEKEADSEQSK